MPSYGLGPPAAALGDMGGPLGASRLAAFRDEGRGLDEAMARSLPALKVEP